MAEQRQAIDKINRLARNGAPNKALQAAYNELLEAVQKGNEKAIEKAVEVAVNEKSRYVAERITRTEMARAWADGFVAKMQKDADIVAVKFKLSSRHPVFDICDMYAKADMYGLGAGIYPKDKLPPLPVHPHCLCRYVEVIEGEVDMQQQRDQVREAGDKWLNSLPESRRAQVLGSKGLKAWEADEDWQEYMRSWRGLGKQESRLRNLRISFNSGIINKRDDGLGRAQNVLYTGKLNRRQKFLLDLIEKNNGIAKIPKRLIGMRDLAALTAYTDKEYAMFTKRGRRLIIQGTSTGVDVNVIKARELREKGYKWSGHTHPGYSLQHLIPSQGDVSVLKAFGQKISAIYNSAGNYSFVISVDGDNNES